MTIKKQWIKICVITSALAISLNLWLAHNPWLGCIFFVVYGAGLILALGSYLNKICNQSFPYFWSGLILLFGLSIIGTIFYYSVGLYRPVLEIILLLPLGILWLARDVTFDMTLTGQPSKLQLKKLALPLFCLLADAFLFYMLKTNETFGVMNSPWLTLKSTFFLGYFITTVLVICASLSHDVKSKLTSYLIVAVHLLLTYSIATIIYPLGFGFDGFIHRATEEWILARGFIFPKQPVYIGQYSIVVWLASITSLTVKTLDTWLVPVLTSLTLPFASTALGACLFKMRREVALQGVWLAPVIFWLSFHLTTPYNLVLLLTILVTTALLIYLKDELPWWIPIILAIASLGTHLLLGANLLALSLAAIILQKKIFTRLKFFMSKTVYVILSVLIAPLLFTLYLAIGDHWRPSFVNPLSNFDLVLDLFKRPYWYAAKAPFLLELLYSWQVILPFVLFGLGVIGFLIQKNKKPVFWLFPLTSLAFAISGWLLRAWFVFPEVGRLEQGDYPLRLFKTSIIFLLPWIGYAIYKASWYLFRDSSKFTQTNDRFAPTNDKKDENACQAPWRYLHLSVPTAVILTLSLYLAYPQENSKAHFPGFNVSKSDYAAVEWIHADNSSNNYVVLANPLIGAAALSKYSFAKYFDTPNGKISYYSIPSGGPLYELYEEMWIRGRQRATMEKAMDLTGVNKAYFVIPEYWTNYEKIVATASSTADRAQSIDGGKVWVFVYER